MPTPLPVVISCQGASGCSWLSLKALGTQPGLLYLTILHLSQKPQLHPRTATMSTLSLPQNPQSIPLIFRR